MRDEHEIETHELTADLAALERQLSGLAPTTPRIDRDRLMFAAGRASVCAPARPRWPGYIAGPSWAGARVWQATTALATAASLVLATMVVRERAEPVKVAEQPAVDAVEAIPTLAEQDAWRWPEQLPSGYLGIRQVVLTQGVGALETKRVGMIDSESDERAAPATARQLLEELLRATEHTRS